MKLTRPYLENTPNINDSEMENPYWLYCVKTNTKLLPRFLYTLASTFIQNRNDYDNVMNNIVKDQGKLSEDGDSWVDEHSGFYIKARDWDVEEGYEDGFRIQSRGILEDDLGQTLATASEKDKKKPKLLNPQSRMVSNIIQTLATFMGFSIDNQSEFIIDTVTNLLNDTNVLVKESTYKKQMEEMAKKGKRIPEYDYIFNSSLLYLTLSTFLIAVQTSIPSIKTRKTFPGCVRSFSGFPIQGEGDYSGLIYLSCVTYKLKSNSIPWNVLSKVKEDKIAENIKNFTLKYLLSDINVEQKIKEKVQYLLVYPDEEIPEEHSIKTWRNFLPPLYKFKIKHLENVSDNFTDSLVKEIRLGNVNQNEKILVIESKIIQFSLAIQEVIQKIVEKKDLLLKSSIHPYMDNACCNEKGLNQLTTLQYFIKDNDDIYKYNSIVNKLSAFQNDIQLLTKAIIFLSEVDTKRSYPALTNSYNEETIYMAFIKYCKFNSFAPTPTDLLPLCSEKPSYINKNESIQESIHKLKRDGKTYSEESLLRLLQIVSRNNLMQPESLYKNVTCIERIQDLFEYFKSQNENTNTNLDPKFINLMENLLKNYDNLIDEDTEDMRSMKNYLVTSNEKTRKQILDFIRQKGDIKRSEYKNIDTFIKNITSWQFDKNNHNENTRISDDAMYNYIQFFKTFVSMLSKVYPNMILNKQTHSMNVPKYWKLSQRHNNDIKKISNSYSEKIQKFYGENKLSLILKKIQDVSNNILLLSMVTPSPTGIKIGEKNTYSVFDKIINTLLFEYYLLQVFNYYIKLTDDPLMLRRSAPKINQPENDENDEDDEDPEYQESMTQGNVNQLKKSVAQLLTTYLTIMIENKNTINVSYDEIMDKVFKLKEREKDTFTDRLKSMSDEEREADTILKYNKLGVWSKGLMKGIREYDPENYDQERDLMNNIAEIEKRVRQQHPEADEGNLDIYMDEYLEQQVVDNEINEDVNDMSYMHDDYLEGNGYGDDDDNDMHDYD